MLTYSLDDKGELSLYEYLYRRIRADIENGVIAPGEKLPSKRSFARHLGVSLITVEGAYSQLVAEGYLRTEPRRGYFACDLSTAGVGLGHGRAYHDAPGSLLASAPSGDIEIAPEEGLAQAYASLSEAGCQEGVMLTKGDACASDLDKLLMEGDASRERELIADFTGASVPLGMFPYASWAKSVRDALTRESERALVGETGYAGTARLRTAIADHLRGFRGMEVDPDCIVVGAGSQVLYGWLVQLLGRDLRYGVEDPGYLRLSRIYEANDVALVHIPLDKEGVDMPSVAKCGVDVLHLMPSHQFPTGIVTSISRRYELLGWASSADNRYLIEDDYDCEFRLTGRPIPSLQSIDASGKVIYANTFTKSLGPAFRIGYMVLPPVLAKRFKRKLGFYSCTVSAIDQLALARFIENGDYERHVNRLRTHYRSIRDDLIAALQASSFAERLSVEEQDAGIHFLMGIAVGGTGALKLRDSVSQGPARRYRFDDDVKGVLNSNLQGATNARWEREFIRFAKEKGVRIVGLSSFYSESAAAEQGPVRRFLMSYGGIDPNSISQAVSALEQAVYAADKAVGWHHSSIKRK